MEIIISMIIGFVGGNLLAIVYLDYKFKKDMKKLDELIMKSPVYTEALKEEIIAQKKIHGKM